MAMDSNLYRGVLGLALALGISAQAHAIPQLRLQSGDSDIVIADGDTTGPYVDADPTSGAVVFMGAIADWTFNVTGGLSKPFLDSPTGPTLDLFSANFGSLSGSTLNIWLTDTDFGPQSGIAKFLSAIGGTTFGTVTYRTFYDDSNVAFGTAHELTNQFFSSLAFSGLSGGEIVSATPYSLTMLVTLAHQGAQLTSFDATVKVPEPSSVLLLGIGLFGIGFAMRRRRSAARA